MELDRVVSGCVALAGGQIVGRIKLQKIMYLMDQLGVNSGANYVYYHYGPYSENLSSAIADAKFWGKLTERTEFRRSDGAPFSVFSTREENKDEALGDMSIDRAKELLKALSSEGSTILELAATVHWLCFVEKVPDWRREIESRKAGKTSNGRLDRAILLLKKLALSPPDC